jgi:ABC-type transport system substrate-binding protein
VACTGAKPSTDLPVPGGTLRVGVREIGTLDPQHAVDAGSLLLARNRYRGLYTIGTDGTTVDALAGSREIKDLGARFTFTIRSDARFSDGATITAQDVVATYNRLVQPATLSPYASLLDVVEGYAAVRDGDARKLSGLVALGSRRVRMILSEPFLPLPTHLAHPALGILPSEARAGRFDPTIPSSGPFLLRSVEPGRRATLVRNRRTTRATAYLEELVLTVVTDGARSLRAGAVDVAYLTTSDQSRLTPRWGMLSIGVDPARLPDAGERRMLASALDRDAIATESQQPWLPLERLVPDGLSADVEVPDPVTIDWPRDGALVFIHLDDPASRSFAEGITRSFTAAAIRVDPRALSVEGYADALDAGTFDLAQLGWLTEVPSPDGFLARQLGSDSPDNQIGYRNPDLDRILDRARATSFPADRAERYATAETLALREAVLIPVVQLGVGFDVGPGVLGVALDGSGTFDAAFAWLAPAA